MMVADLFLAQSLVKKVRLNRALHDDDSLTFPRLLARFPPPARRLIESTPARPQTTRITHKLVVARASTCFMRTTHQKPTWTLSRAVKGLELPLPYELELFPSPAGWSRSLLGSYWDINTRSAALMGRRQQMIDPEGYLRPSTVRRTFGTPCGE